MPKYTSKKYGWLFVKEWRPDCLSPSIKLLDPHERWRRVAKILKVSKNACLRLEWIIYHHEGHSVTETARHFGITRKTFYRWFKEFDPENLLSLHKLEE